MKLHQTVIVAHPTRQHWANELATKTDAAHTTTDHTNAGCYRNHLAAWEWHHHHPNTRWAITLEDDALPILDFPRQAALALTYAPTPIVSFYLGRQRPPQHQKHIATALIDAAGHNHAWITTPKLLHAVAVAIKTDILGSVVARLRRARHFDIDEAITQWARSHTMISYTVPSLVDHRDGQTIARHRDSAPRQPGRIAWNTGQRDNWNTPATEMRL